MDIPNNLARQLVTPPTLMKGEIQNTAVNDICTSISSSYSSKYRFEGHSRLTSYSQHGYIKTFDNLAFFNSLQQNAISTIIRLCQQLDFTSLEPFVRLLLWVALPPFRRLRTYSQSSGQEFPRTKMDDRRHYLKGKTTNVKLYSLAYSLDDRTNSSAHVSEVLQRFISTFNHIFNLSGLPATARPMH